MKEVEKKYEWLDMVQIKQMHVSLYRKEEIPIL